MKRNQNFDPNHSQKVLSCHYNMDTNRVEARFADGTTLAIDCIAIEDEYGNTPAQQAELDWLLYNKPLEYVQLVLSGEIEHTDCLAFYFLKKERDAIDPTENRSCLPPQRKSQSRAKAALLPAPGEDS